MLTADCCFPQELQRYIDQRPPDGFGLLYAWRFRAEPRRVYIGQSVNKAAKRRWDHVNVDARTYIHRAIVSHGEHAFDFGVVALVPLQQLDQAEIDAIARYGALRPNGYNIKGGGEGGGKWSDEGRKMLKAAQNRPEVLQAHRAAAKLRMEKPGKKAAFRKAGVEWQTSPVGVTFHRKKMQAMWDERHDELVATSNAAKAVRVAARVVKARAECMPYEFVKANRVKGCFYMMQDGVGIGRWSGHHCDKVCDVEPGNEQRAYSQSKLIKLQHKRRRSL